MASKGKPKASEGKPEMSERSTGLESHLGGSVTQLERVEVQP